MLITDTANRSTIRLVKNSRAVRIGATASALAVVLAGAVAGPAVAAPGEARQVHVEGQLIPVDDSPGIYRISGGLVGTYKVQSERTPGPISVPRSGRLEAPS